MYHSELEWILYQQATIHLLQEYNFFVYPIIGARRSVRSQTKDVTPIPDLSGARLVKRQLNLRYRLN
jgi:hypothetical protein